MLTTSTWKWAPETQELELSSLESLTSGKRHHLGSGCAGCELNEEPGEAPRSSSGPTFKPQEEGLGKKEPQGQQGGVRSLLEVSRFAGGGNGSSVSKKLLRTNKHF